MFRANRTKSIRAPAITELFLPSATVFSFANDPCDKNFVNQGTAPATRRANCIAAGIDPTTFVSNVVNATAIGTTSGNTNLQSETADSRTVGVVLQPRFIPRLNIQVDLIDIKLTEAIETLSLVQVLDACYDASDYPSNPSCQAFTRGATHQITNFHVGYVNAGLLEFRGITAALDYTFDLPRSLGSVQTRINYLDTKKILSQVGSASPNELSGELANSPGVPQSKGRSTWTTAMGPLGGIGRAVHRFHQFQQPEHATSQDYWAAWRLVADQYDAVLQRGQELHGAAHRRQRVQQGAAVSGDGRGAGQFHQSHTLYFSGIIGRTYLVSASLTSEARLALPSGGHRGSRFIRRQAQFLVESAPARASYNGNTQASQA